MVTRRNFLKGAGVAGTVIAIPTVGGLIISSYLKDSNPYFSNRVEFYKANEPFSNDPDTYIQELKKCYDKIDLDNLSEDQQNFLDLGYDASLEKLVNRRTIPREILDSGDKLSKKDLVHIYNSAKIVGGL